MTKDIEVEMFTRLFAILGTATALQMQLQVGSANIRGPGFRAFSAMLDAQRLNAAKTITEIIDAIRVKGAHIPKSPDKLLQHTHIDIEDDVPVSEKECIAFFHDQQKLMTGAITMAMNFARTKNYETIMTALVECMRRHERDFFELRALKVLP